MKRKILIIDDDRDFVEMNKIVLESRGFEVIEGCDGDEGYEKAVRERPDLIVLDVMMNTAGEGFEVSRKLRENKGTQGIPIIMLTSINSSEYKPPSAVGKFGPDDTWAPVDVLLDKPVKPAKLLAEVNTLMG